jgi:hypothetical protein
MFSFLFDWLINATGSLQKGKDAGLKYDQQQNKRQTVFVVETLYLFFSILSAKGNPFLLTDNHLFNKTSFKTSMKTFH